MRDWRRGGPRCLLRLNAWTSAVERDYDNMTAPCSHPSCSYLLISLLCASANVFVAEGASSRNIQNNYVDLTKEWIKASKEFDSYVWPQKELILKVISTLNEDKDLPLSDACDSSLTNLSNGLQTRQSWAYKVMDATGRGRSGMAYGYLADLGNIDECLSVSVEQFVPQFCNLRIRFPVIDKAGVSMRTGASFNLKDTELEGTVYENFAHYLELMTYTDTAFYFGLCLPRACTSTDIETVVNKFTGNGSLQFELTPHCEYSGRSTPFYQRISIILTLVYMGFVVLANLMLRFTTPEKAEGSFISNFDVRTNVAILFKEASEPLSRTLGFVHGVKVIYQVLMVLAHIWDIQPLIPQVYPLFYDRDYSWVFEQLGRCVGFSIQVIFFISGALVTAVFYNDVILKKQKTTFSIYMAKRFFRTTPTLVAAIVLSFAFAGLASGPVNRNVQEKYVETCTTYWWGNLLYISNWFSFDNQCLFHTWTQSADLQLYALSYVVLWWLFTKPNRGITACLFLMVASMVSSGVVTYIYDLPAHANFDGTDAREYDVAGLIYAHTYHNMGSYFLGVLLCFMLIQNWELPAKYHSTGWVLTLGLHVFTLYMPWSWESSGVEPPRWQEVLFAACHRMTYVSLFAYIGYMCAFRTGGVLNKFFELKFWVPLSRMSMSTFLVHFMLIWFDVASDSGYMPTRMYNMWAKLVYMTLFTWSYGFLIYITVEAPAMNYCKSLLKKSTRKSHNALADVDTNNNTVGAKVSPKKETAVATHRQKLKGA